MAEADLIPTRCAICGTQGQAAELHPANFSLDHLTAEVFSARRLPDRIHYRLVKCHTCGLVRSDPVVAPARLAQLYAQSTFTYGGEVGDLRRTYGRYLAKLIRCGARKNALLEIGCGSGFFLEEALDRGFQVVRGIEPSQQAIDQAAPRVRGGIMCGLMGPGIFHADQFDVICLFQVFDHLLEPGALLDECFRLLKPGGFMLCINHNIEAISARLLGERSPIIDVEHTYLYSPATMARIFLDHGFHIRRRGGVWNTYHLGYLMRLIPMPAALKRRLLDGMKNSRIGRLRLSVPLGNLYLMARKPDEAPTGARIQT